MSPLVSAEADLHPYTMHDNISRSGSKRDRKLQIQRFVIDYLEEIRKRLCSLPEGRRVHDH